LKKPLTTQFSYAKIDKNEKGGEEDAEFKEARQEKTSRLPV